MKFAFICCILVFMATFPASATDPSIVRLAQDPACAQALNWIDGSSAWVTEQQIRITETPAPEYGEKRRAELLQSIFADMGYKVRIDETGNVVVERIGMQTDRIVLVAMANACWRQVFRTMAPDSPRSSQSRAPMLNPVSARTRRSSSLRMLAKKAKAICAEFARSSMLMVHASQR